ncbi:MAG: gamma-glutamylcyclotransferase [Nostoc sp.]|uniref:gamma-glutamylcyclotransferase n=1 Tax=Nostoc sp. TaxID=1180 RepID=UPI002FFCDF3C
MEIWWQTDEMQGYVQEALIHINGARQAGINSTERCKRLFDALNKLWSAHNQNYFAFHGRYYHTESNEHPSDNKSLFALLTQGIPDALQEELAFSPELQQLVEFDPKILNHDVLRRHRYVPGQQIEPTLLGKANETHKKLSNAYIRFTAEKSAITQTAVLNKAAQLIYVVRSNIAHGEKTPYGPDKEKVQRDQQVCAKVAPLLTLIINLIFDKPDHKFLVYGTLAPGQPNHMVIENLHGTWVNCQITGQLKETNGLMHLNWHLYGDDIQAKMFTSDDLPQSWSAIDKFEGSDYCRILVPAKIEGTKVIANTYQ